MSIELYDKGLTDGKMQVIEFYALPNIEWVLREIDRGARPEYIKKLLEGFRDDYKERMKNEAIPSE